MERRGCRWEESYSRTLWSSDMSQAIGGDRQADVEGVIVVFAQGARKGGVMLAWHPGKIAAGQGGLAGATRLVVSSSGARK